MSDLEECSCGFTEWQLDKAHFDLHGYGIRCAKCGKFLRWTGKGREKSKNSKFREKHRQTGELTCDFCGISESEAKKMGFHFAIDHIEAEQFGGNDQFKNTRPLCSPCHYLKTALEFKTKGIRKILENQ